MSVSFRSLPRPHVDPASLRAAMRQVVGGVAVITAGIGDERTGFTATSAVSLSMSPPTMLICIDRASSSFPVIQKRRHVCVNILHAGQEDVARRFAGAGGAKGLARYEGADWVTLGSGAAGLVGALAMIDCEVEEIIERHSHGIILGAVRDVQSAADAEHALAYANGQFGRLEMR